MNVVVNRTRCIGIGICESIAEEYFEVNDDGSLTVLQESVSSDDLGLVREAVLGCPGRALTLVEE
jgi:ferredoxin